MSVGIDVAGVGHRPAELLSWSLGGDVGKQVAVTA